ncbi:MAG: YIP1 family protein [Pseudohongiellaceae bacterium]|nr:YIP1 family protein [Pseudohongiellaceae bacterium]
MNTSVSSITLFQALIQPKYVFQQLAHTAPSSVGILFRHSIWLLLLPPLFSLIGGYSFGWRLGAEEPLFLPLSSLLMISGAYFVTLLFGFVSTALISRWMAGTYGANTELGLHVALVTIVGEPLALASASHIFPDVFFNVLVLIPAAIWSMYLLYSGLPVALEIPPERGMLMASSLVGWLLVAAVSLLGLTVGLWTAGFGPVLGV